MTLSQDNFINEIQERLTFRFNMHEIAFFEKNPNLNQTATLHDGMYLIMKKTYEENVERISLRIFFILAGMIVVAYSPMLIYPQLFVFTIICGMVIIVFGFIMLGFEVRVVHGRRKR